MSNLIAPADFALNALRIVAILNLGFAAVLAGILLLSLICCGAEWLGDRRDERHHTSLRFAVLVALLLSAGTSLHAQSEPEVPTIEPTFTRLFGSDTLEIYGASMSPDGRWVMFGGENLWVVSASGGEPIRLTEGKADGAVWFPTSDRIAFRSSAIMTLPIDRETGQPTGPPRPVTLEGSQAYFDVSPDGKWIAYTPRQDGQRVIRIVPSNGGTARTLIAADTPRPMWSADGRYIYYHVASGSGMGLARIPAGGGRPDTTTAAGWIRLGHSSLLLSSGGNSRDFTVTTLTNRAIARFHLPGEMRPPGTTGLDSTNRFVGITSNHGAALHVLPVDGGPVRQLTEGQEEDKPIAWTDDGRILFSTHLNGNEVLLLAPAGGGAMRQVSLSEERLKLLNGRVPPPFLSSDGSHLFYQVKSEDPELSVLKVLSLESGTTQEITSAHPAGGGGVVGPGGVPHFNGQDFLYVERKPGEYELWAWTPDGSRLLRAFGDQLSGRIGVLGDRIVFPESSDDRVTLRIATLGEAVSRELASVIGKLQSVGWSPNGQYIAMVHVDTSGGGESARVAFQRVSPSGEPIGDLHYVGEPSLSWWNLRWLPDGRGVLANSWDDHNVWFLPVDPNESPVCVTQDEPKGVDEFVLSPDGKHIVYPSRVARGSSIWLVDLGEIRGGSK
jgi:Tol biopolymer transport system component